MLGRLNRPGPVTMKNWLPPLFGAPVLAMATEPAGYWAGWRLGRQLVGDGVAGSARAAPGRVTGLDQLTWG